MSSFMIHFDSWYWFGFAIFLFIIEMLTGTGFLLWVGISATFISLLLLFIPSVSLGTQLIVFSITSVIAALSWRIFLSYHPLKTEDPKLNKRAKQYIGRTFTLEFPIINGMGKIHVDDSMWRLQCEEDLPSGSKIKIIDANGIILIAEKNALGNH